MSKVELITPRKLRQIAGSILDFLVKENIDSIKSLEKRLGESFAIKRQDHVIQIELRPSESGSEAYTISYIMPRGGIPIEIRINLNFNYSKIIVKTNSGLNDYTPVIYDYFGNIIQDKRIDDCSILEIKKELEKLAS